MSCAVTTGISEIQTVDSDSVNLGSNPSPPATEIFEKYGFSGPGQEGPFGLSELFGRTEPGTCWCGVYFATDGELVKIGWSDDSGRRMKGLRSPRGRGPIRLIVTIEAHPQDERVIHRRFEHLRVSGEWFRPDDELNAFVEAIRLLPRPKGKRRSSLPEMPFMALADRHPCLTTHVRKLRAALQRGEKARAAQLAAGLEIAVRAFEGAP